MSSPSGQTSTSAPPQPPRSQHQPLHPSVIPHLDPQYIAFHNQHIAHLPKTEDSSFHPSQRAGGALMPGASALRKVGKTDEFEIGQNGVNVRVWTPVGEKPDKGWPVLLWFHGGGWVLGGLDTENHFCTAMTEAANCVTMTVDYRLAPEHPWPAAVDDAIEALQWVVNQGVAKLDLDSSRIAVGGSSAGGNLSAILCNRAPSLSPPVTITYQLINVPVLDNSRTTYSINSNAPWLSPSRMLWYRHLYLPDRSTWSHPDASPLLAEDTVLAKTPKTFVGIADQDILAPEAQAYADKLQRLGVEVEVMECKGATHSVPNLDDVMDIAKELIRKEGDELRKAFWGAA